jgi:E3 ubiquitin-protein ligase SHPRH
MNTIKNAAKTQSFTEIPEFDTSVPKGGLESRRLIEKLDALGATLDAQANQLDEWRETLIQSLIQPLVDEADESETKGDEYELSTKTQDEGIYNVSCTEQTMY